MCDGPCMRSFHAGMKDSEEDEGEQQVYDARFCNPVNIPPDLFKALTQQGSERFNCPNCLAGIQQCFVCKKEGQADSEVFRCESLRSGSVGASACFLWDSKVAECGKLTEGIGLQVHDC